MAATCSFFFFLLMMIMMMSWATTLIQLPPATAMMTTTAQPPRVTNYTIESKNVRRYYNYFDRNLRPWAQQNLRNVSDFIRNRILCRQTQMHAEVILRFEDTLPPPNDRAYALGGTIWMSVGFIAASPLFKDQAERVSYFQRTVYHEMTHVWQFLTGYNSGRNPTHGLVEGMADYAAAKGHGSGFLTCLPSAGDVWYDAYCVTAKFLFYLEGTAGYAGAVCNINLMMRNGYDEDTFRGILGGRKPEDVWDDYLNSLQPPTPRPDGDDDDDVAAATTSY